MHMICFSQCFEGMTVSRKIINFTPSSYMFFWSYESMFRQIVFLFGIIFRHVVLLVTEILHQDGNTPGPEVIKLFSMLNSAEHEIYPAHKC